LGKLQKGLPIGENATNLSGTALVELTDTKALIFVPNRTAVAWIERRLYAQIANALKGVLGKDLDLQFITAS
jgi:chromosomal replication initiation ATPase DnaA